MNWRQGGFFVIASAAAGLLHYLFQLAAARGLSAPDFAQFSQWFAQIAFCFFIGGILQYAANFAPARRPFLRASIVALNLFLILLGVIWFTHEGLTFTHAALVVISSCVFNWFFGQAQIRLAFTTLAIASLTIGAAKLIMALNPAIEPSDLNRYAFPLFACYIPAIWMMSYVLWSKEDPKTTGQVSWLAPIVLSVAGAGIPQFDILLMSYTQTPEAFQEFAQASLFYRGIYFVVAIVAQWLLPHQIHGNAGSMLKNLGVVAAAAAALSGAMAWLAPGAAQAVLNWQTAPAQDIVFLSCIHMSLLTLLFLWIQETCAGRRPRLAAAVLSVLALEAGAQWLFQFQVRDYLILVSLVQLSILAAAYRLNPARYQQPEPGASSSENRVAQARNL